MRIGGRNDAKKMLIDREKMLVLPFSKAPSRGFALSSIGNKASPCKRDYRIQHRHRT